MADAQIPRGGPCRNFHRQEKITYASEEEAQVVVKRLQGIKGSASRRRPYVAYPCPFGHVGWHVGRAPRRKGHRA